MSEDNDSKYIGMGVAIGAAMSTSNSGKYNDS